MLSLHVSMVSIGGGRVAAKLRAGDLIYIHAVLTVPATDGGMTNTTMHEQLRVPVPPELPEGAAVSVENAVSLRLSSSQLVALRSCSSKGSVSGREEGGLEVRVLHQPRMRVFGESGYKNVGEMTAIGVGVVDLENVWAASRWAGIVHLNLCEGQEHGRKAISRKDNKGKANAHKSVPATKTASRYASLHSRAPVGDGHTQQLSSQSVVGRVELAVTLLTCKPDETAPLAEHATCPTDASCSVSSIAVSEGKVCLDGGKRNEERNSRVERNAEDAADGRPIHQQPARCLFPEKDEQQQQQQQPVWLLLVEDVVGIKWTNTLRITCRMVWVEGEVPQPQLKTCLHCRRKRVGSGDTINLTVFEARAGTSTKGKEQHALLVLELWELDASGMSKQLMGLVQLEPRLPLQDAPAKCMGEDVLVSGCAVMMEGSFPVRSPFSGKDVGTVHLSLFSGTLANIQTIMQRHDTALHVQVAAHETLHRLRSRQALHHSTRDTWQVDDTTGDTQQLHTSSLVAHDMALSQNARSGFAELAGECKVQAVSSCEEEERGCANEAAGFGATSSKATESEQRLARNKESERAGPRPLALKYRLGAQGDAGRGIEKVTHTITLTIVGVARFPWSSADLDASADSTADDTGVRDSSDMMVYRPCGIYVRSQVPGDSDETLTPVVPVCSHLALHAQSSRSLVLAKDEALVDSVFFRMLVATPSWDFQVMHRPKGAISAASDRQIGHAKLGRDDIIELLRGDTTKNACLQGSTVTIARSLPVCMTGACATAADAPQGSNKDCILRVRLTYEKTPYIGAESCAKSVIASANSGLEGEFLVSNSLQLRDLRMSGLKAAADKLAQKHTRCRLVPFDGPNTCVLFHFSPTPPWQDKGGAVGGGDSSSSSAKRFHASETVVHSFCPVFSNFSRDIALKLTEETLEYLNTGMLVVEAWHRLPRDALGTILRKPAMSQFN